MKPLASSNAPSLALTHVLCAATVLLWLPMIVLAHDKSVKEIEVSALTAQEKVQWARAAKIPLMDAVKTALARTPGQAIQVTLESLKGRLLYEIEIVTGDGTVIEMFVDPQSGTIIEPGGAQ